jgi:hypothetical protein
MNGFEKWLVVDSIINRRKVVHTYSVERGSTLTVWNVDGARGANDRRHNKTENSTAL